MDELKLSSAIKQVAQTTIISIIEQVHGQKDLIISPNIISPLDLICGVGLLREAGVEKIFRLESGPASPGSSANCCFLLRSEIEEFRILSDLINADIVQNRPGIKYFAFVIPRLTFECEQLIEEDGIHGLVNFIDCPLYFFPLEIDVISLERPDLFKTLFLEGDLTSVYSMSQSLIQLEQLIGQFSEIYCQGQVSKNVVKLMETLQMESSKNGSKISSSENQVTNKVLLMDRNVDYASTLLSQLNYEGLLDETFGINCGKVSFPKEVTKNGSNLKYSLASWSDLIFNEIRDNHLSLAFLKLKQKGAELKQKHDERRNMNLNDMKNFVNNHLKQTQSQHELLSLHVSACEKIMEEKKSTNFVDRLKIERDLIENVELKASLDMIETLIIKQVSPTITLRLLCLLSLTSDGCSSKDFKDLTRYFVQSFGHEHIVTFFQLQKLGLFLENTSSSSFASASSNNLTSRLTLNNFSGDSLSSSSINNSTLGSSVNKPSVISSLFSSKNKFKATVKKLNLVPVLKEGESYDFKNPKDTSFVFGGNYIPMVISILDIYFPTNGSAPNEELVKVIPGERYLSKKCNKITNSRKSSSVSISSSSSSSAFLIYFIGGVTFAEITAIRFWAQKRNVKVMIATTGILNGNSLLKQMMPVKPVL